MRLTRFLSQMTSPAEDDEDDEIYEEHLQLARVFVFEPAKKYIIFLFHNWDNLILDETDLPRLDISLCMVHFHVENIEIDSDEHDAEFVSELVRWEVGQMVDLEIEIHFVQIFEHVLNRTLVWDREKPERQKRREVLLREEGWDDAFELRVVGIEVEAPEDVKDLASLFRILSSFNSDLF
ncbi:hypothetical protein BLNAU_6051 [Blattamonas nauphoetae]|uniref:Uncharacterized protein n=1 Tax=Blattamonas nauphoetae TaxID=2049346 RepID=A0ABQ9Y5L1_9EUKA|nr:hypothetical protein BLNAU_6051 [Blattamonas nauphoetae]